LHDANPNISIGMLLLIIKNWFVFYSGSWRVAINSHIKRTVHGMAQGEMCIA
jgi:hypothetical protein